MADADQRRSRRFAAAAIVSFAVAVYCGGYWIVQRNRRERVPAPAAATVKRLRILVGYAPPYVGTGKQGGSAAEGIEVQKIRAALSSDGRYQPEFVVEPFSRHWASFASSSDYDAVATVPEGMNLTDGYLSCRCYVWYQNGVGYRRSKFSESARWGKEDFDFAWLRGARVAAFAGALEAIPGLRERVAAFGLYVERRDQQVQTALLVDQLVDVVIEDREIFEHYVGTEPASRRGDLEFLAVFSPTPYRMLFRRREHRDAFDAGIGDVQALNEDLARKAPCPPAPEEAVCP